jgi:hypothetical protein
MLVAVPAVAHGLRGRRHPPAACRRRLHGKHSCAGNRWHRERKQKEMAAAGGQMSLFWLATQFFVLGMMENTSVGLLMFFNSEAPHNIKSIGVALFWCQTGMACSWYGW